jgi:hypothetical protein
MTSTQSSSQICRCGSTKAELQAEPVHPRFDLGGDQVEDVLAYFKSLNGETQ